MNRASKWLPLLALIVLPSLGLAQNAKVTAIVLDVKTRPSASAAWKKAKVGTQLGAGAQVRTGKRSKCEIKFPDGSLIRLSPLSDLVIAKLVGKDLSMGYGKLYARIVKGTSARIQGGTGVASIKGTTLEFDAGDIRTLAERRKNVLSIFQGLADLSGPGGSQGVGPNSQSVIGADGAPSGSAAVPGSKFSGFQPGQWWEGVEPGKSIMATPSSYAGIEQKQDTISSGRPPHFGTAGRFPLQDGTINVDIRSALRAQSAQEPRLALAMPPPTAMLEVPPAMLLEGPPLRAAFGKRFFGPEVRTDLFALWSTEGNSIAGARVRPTAIWGDVYFEVGGTTWTDFDGWRTELTEAFAKVRPESGDLTVGRQHFLVGPVNNSNLGSLVGFDTADAVRWQPRVGDFRLDAAYIHDLMPFDGDDPRGAYFRGEISLFNGTLGLNKLHLDDIGTGVSFDFAVPLVEGKWDVYGEIGSDPAGAEIQTWGSYFPDLYQRYDVDLFVEYAHREGAPRLLSLYAYREYEHQWTGFLSLQHSSADDVVFSLGAIKRFD